MVEAVVRRSTHFSPLYQMLFPMSLVRDRVGHSSNTGHGMPGTLPGCPEKLMSCTASLLKVPDAPVLRPLLSTQYHRASTDGDSFVLDPAILLQQGWASKL